MENPTHLLVQLSDPLGQVGVLSQAEVIHILLDVGQVLVEGRETVLTCLQVLHIHVDLFLND